MDIALILDWLLPATEYGGVPGSTKVEYDTLPWEDKRTKPTWTEIEAAWPAVEQKMIEERDKPDALALLEGRMTAMESELSALKVSRG